MKELMENEQRELLSKRSRQHNYVRNEVDLIVIQVKIDLAVISGRVWRSRNANICVL